MWGPKNTKMVKKKEAGQVGQFLKKVRMRQKYRDMKKIEKILTKVRYQSQPSIFNFMLVFSVLSFVNYSLTGRTIMNKN